MKSLFSIVFITFLLSACVSKVNDMADDLAIQSKLKEAEIATPNLFIDLTGNINNTELYCNVNSIAKYTTYTDVIVSVNYFTDTRSLIKSEVVALDKSISPKGITVDTVQVNPPGNFTYLSVSLKQALGAE